MFSRSCMKYMDVNCKTALITGGTSDIGLAIADALLSAGLQKAYLSGINDGQGAEAVWDMVKKHGVGKCDYIRIDVNDHKIFEDAFNYIICKEGSLDILVNNAGMLNDEKWELQFDTNVKGVIRGILLANKYMPKHKNKGGCVVNIVSISGFDCFPYSPGYNSTKHAVVGLTKSFGDPLKFRRTGVRLVAVGPGVTGTDLAHKTIPIMLNEAWKKKEDARLSNLPSQSEEAVGRGALYTVEYGPPGSLWVVEDYRLQRVLPPRRETYQIKDTLHQQDMNALYNFSFMTIDNETKTYEKEDKDNPDCGIRTNAERSSGALSNKYGISIGKDKCDFLMGNRNHMNMNGAKHYSSDIPCKKYLDVKCKTALITGGATGIGLAIAESLLAAGLQKAYLASNNSCDGVKALLLMNYKYGDGRCDFIPIDVNNQKQFEDAFKYITCKEGSVDILVNNAGILNDKAWELEFDTNIKGVIRGTLLANKYMPKQKNKGGVVVNIASILGFDNYPFTPGYNSTKHAVVGLTKSFGEPSKFQSNGVRHLAIGPGVTWTNLIRECETKMLTEEWGKKTLADLNSLPSQSIDAVGRGTLYTIEYGPPGSLWIIEDCLLERLILPKRGTYQLKVKDL